MPSPARPRRIGSPACGPPCGLPGTSSPRSASSPGHPWYQRKDASMCRVMSRSRTSPPGPWPSPARQGSADTGPRLSTRSSLSPAQGAAADTVPQTGRTVYIGSRRRIDHRHNRRRVIPRLRQAGELLPCPHPTRSPARARPAMAALLDSRRAAELTEQTQDRREPEQEHRLGIHSPLPPGIRYLGPGHLTSGLASV